MNDGKEISIQSIRFHVHNGRCFSFNRIFIYFYSNVRDKLYDEVDLKGNPLISISGLPFIMLSYALRSSYSSDWLNAVTTYEQTASILYPFSRAYCAELSSNCFATP